MQPVIPDVGGLAGFNPVAAAITLLGGLVCGLIIAWVYRAAHRGLSYSQSFQFALVLFTMLGGVVMLIASGSLLQAIGILGAFSLVRFRTAIKDPKDMAYILLVLAVGMSMGAGLYALSILTTVVVCVVILLLTWMNFGISDRHESVVRLICKEGKVETAAGSPAHEAVLTKTTDSFRLLSAHARGDRMELTYGVRPRRNESALAILEALRKEESVEDAELFDAKHQVEF